MLVVSICTIHATMLHCTVAQIQPYDDLFNPSEGKCHIMVHRKSLGKHLQPILYIQY
jgi:hypothetical protein